MTVKTTPATQRRRLRFESLDEVLADAENLAVLPTRQLGNWSLGQNLMHLATVYEKSIDGTIFRPGWLLRVFAKVFMPLWKRLYLFTNKEHCFSEAGLCGGCTTLAQAVWHRSSSPREYQARSPAGSCQTS